MAVPTPTVIATTGHDGRRIEHTMTHGGWCSVCRENEDYLLDVMGGSPTP